MKSKYHIYLLILFSLSIIFVFACILILIDIDEKFDKGFEIGELIFNFALSTIAATIFYGIVDYFPRKKRKKEMLANSEIHISNIENAVDTILANLNYKQGQEILTINNTSFRILEMA